MTRPWVWSGLLLLNAFTCTKAALRDFAHNVLKSTTYDIYFDDHLVTKSDTLKLLRNEFYAVPEVFKTNAEEGNLTITWGDPTSYELFRITPSESYLCRFPPHHHVEQSKQGPQKHILSREEKDNILDGALAILKQKRGICASYVHGYFTYQFCYDQHVLQLPTNYFLELATAETTTNIPVDPAKNVFLMGKWSNELNQSSETQPSARHNTQQEKASVLRPTSSIEDNGSTIYSDQSVYMEQTWRDGSVCDLNGNPRTTRIQVRVFPDPVLLHACRTRPD